MAKVKNENYCTIQGWMINELNLKGAELMAYAVIYGFSQARGEEQYMTCSQEYIAEWCNVSRQQINKILKTLEEKKFIVKKISRQNGAVKSYDYRAVSLDEIMDVKIFIENESLKEEIQDSENIPDVASQESLHATSQESLHATSQESLHVTSQQSLHATSQQSLHATSQESLHATCQQSLHHNNIKDNYIKDNNKSNLSYPEDKDILEYIKKQIDYDEIKNDSPDNIQNVEDIAFIMADVLSSTQKTITVNRETKPAETVKAQFSKIKKAHVMYIIHSMENNTSRARNIRSYLITSLYNSVSTKNLFWQNAALSDMTVKEE